MGVRNSPTKAPGPKKKTNPSTISSKRGNFIEKDDEHIIKLHSFLGNQWSLIASFFPGRTDDEIKKYWNTHIKRKLYSRGIDPQTHRPLTAANANATATPTATDRVAVVNSNNNNNSKFQQQYINRTQQNSDDSNNSISSTSIFSIWEKGESIGAGGYGTVYVARNRETRALCAVKELKDIHKLGNIESIQKETKILSQLEHTNIVKYYGHEIVGRHISLYMEYVQPGSLKKYILEKGVLHEPLIRNFTAQILSGLVYLHSKRVVHRDIKPDNLLVDSNNIVKLVDFGLAKHLKESVGKHSILGTPYYAAPELVNKKIEYQSSRQAYAADIWSLGCVIIEMFSGKRPWLAFEPMQVLFEVGRKQHPPIPEKLCQEGKDFLELCFKTTPADRPSASALLGHPFVKAQTT